MIVHLAATQKEWWVIDPVTCNPCPDPSVVVSIPLEEDSRRDPEAECKDCD